MVDPTPDAVGEALDSLALLEVNFAGVRRRTDLIESHIATLTAKLAAAQKNEARYLWLRDQHNDRNCELAVMYDDGMIEDRHLYDAECVDLGAAVDAAMENAK